MSTIHNLVLLVHCAATHALGVVMMETVTLTYFHQRSTLRG
jgi:hypothetical protein